MKDYINKTIEDIKRQVGNEQVLLGLSGGVDSAVCAALISKAIPNQLVCIFVDHGFMRKNEAKDVISVFGNKDLKLIAVDASERFLKKLEGVADPEKKRKIIGAEFVEVFNDEALKLGRIKFLAQGTIRSDVVESGDGKSATIKSHHNVGGLPEKMGFTGLVEPLRALYKDQVREVGKLLGLPDSITQRQPFPGPGLAIRIIGDIAKEKLDMLREADYIYREEIDKLKKKPDQYFAVLTNTRTVGVQKGERTYGYVLALRAVETVDFMKANYAQIPHSTLAKISERITEEVKGITRVVFDITGKPALLSGVDSKRAAFRLCFRNWDKSRKRIIERIVSVGFQRIGLVPILFYSWKYGSCFYCKTQTNRCDNGERKEGCNVCLIKEQISTEL